MRLEDLRDQLDELDASLIDLAAKRLDLVRQVAEAKVASGGKLFDRGRERVVLDRARRLSRERGVDPELGASLVHALVEAGHGLQAKRLAESTSGQRRSVLIVGGAGEMGRLFQRAFTERGHRVDVLEKGDGRDRAEAVAAADVVLIAVSMAVAEQVAAELLPLVRPDALLCDINSLKQGICEVYAGGGSCETLGLHPMFGGSVGSLRRQKVVACPVRPGPLSTWLLAELGALGLEVIESTPADHDRMMAVVQVLLHFRTVVSGEAFRRAGVAVADSLRFTSPIYRLEMSVVARLFAQDAQLYASILLGNPAAAEMRGHFLDAAQEVSDLLAAGDREGFQRLFDGVHDWFGPFSEEAMRMSDAIIDGLTSRA